METNQVRHPAHSDSLQYKKKSGAFLLFSGVSLGLAGATLTTMGWYHYPENANFGWTQFLGPILISIGGTVILTSFYRIEKTEEESPPRYEDIYPSFFKTT
ncbi:Transmembrane protein 174 [Dissostichus eleginoides]|uniref:Transmembrane protein 174 n=1 Tax=Dissostichus eleginoides TaxID=100907 RepID=A0AAD9EW11_DISEL|nr:Transmembrane protein 174 [Dissostichus eleginoides]